MKIKGSLASIDVQTILELAKKVVERNQAIVEQAKKETKEAEDRYNARPWWQRIIYDEPYCYKQACRKHHAEDAIDHANNLIRLCKHTETELYLSPQDAAFIGLSFE